MPIERWDPFREVVSLRDNFNRLFDEALMRPGAAFLANVRDLPALNMYEKDDMIFVEVHLPGIKREEVEVTLNGPVLTIKGERKAEEEVKEENYMRREVHYGSFMRRITLPDTAELDNAEAEFADGVLKISFPKRAEPQPKKIELKEEAVPM
jgi:HSP20 family protein